MTCSAMFIKQTAHKNIKIIMAHCGKKKFSQQRVVDSPAGKVHDQ